MARIIIVLPSNRAYAGSLHVENDEGERVLGPFAVCGRSQAEEAARHGNPNRSPLLPYGDTPLGGYRVREVVASNGGTGYPAEAYGPSGIVVLDATSGDAALAEANGRYHIFIQGGATGSSKRLRATNGCLRLFDRDQAKLVKLLATYPRPLPEGKGVGTPSPTPSLKGREGWLLALCKRANR